MLMMITKISRLFLSVLLLASSSANAVSVGEQAPGFVLPFLNEPEAVFNLKASTGKVRYLDFWASWCAPCRLSLPAIDLLKKELGDENFEVIAINLDERPEDAKRFLRRYLPSYKILMDPSGKTAAQYEIPGMPTSFIIDHLGQIKFRHTGFKENDIDVIRRQVTSLLEASQHEN